MEVPVRRFRRVTQYLDSIGLDSQKALAEAGIAQEHFDALADDDMLSVADYSRLYSKSIKHMQSLNRPIPWAAGLGSDAFELMCSCIISCKTLGEALDRAQRFDKLLYPLLGYKMSVHREDAFFELRYYVNTPTSEEAFVPKGWSWAEHFQTVAFASGLMVWSRFCSWLVGHTLELESVRVAGPIATPSYAQSQQTIFACPIEYDAETTALRAPLDYLSHRIVHSPESLARFLENSVYELVVAADESRSTTAAIRSLISRDIQEGIPSFEAMAATLHSSQSGLRRRLQNENTSYQEIKDQLRCELAIEQLHNLDTRISTLSELLGFAETSSFIRSFRGWTGKTPKEYRDSLATSNTSQSASQVH